MQHETKMKHATYTEIKASITRKQIAKELLFTIATCIVIYIAGVVLALV